MHRRMLYGQKKRLLQKQSKMCIRDRYYDDLRLEGKKKGVEGCEFLNDRYLFERDVYKRQVYATVVSERGIYEVT